MTRCCYRGCHAPAAWLPVLVLYAEVGGDPARGLLDLPLCDAHAATITPADLISDAGWRQITTGFLATGHVAPQREAAEVETVALDSDEARAFLRLRPQ